MEILKGFSFDLQRHTAVDLAGNIVGTGANPSGSKS